MVYEFMGKIMKINKTELLSENALKECIEAVSKKTGKTMDVRILLDQDPQRDILVKAKESISSFSKVQEEEVSAAIVLFKDYLDEIAHYLDGDVSRTEGYYNNNKMFNKLW
jgi:uncharacterized protein YueI